MEGGGDCGGHLSCLQFRCDSASYADHQRGHGCTECVAVIIRRFDQNWPKFELCHYPYSAVTFTLREQNDESRIFFDRDNTNSRVFSGMLVFNSASDTPFVTTTVYAGVRGSSSG